jgi:hypothetical protein
VGISTDNIMVKDERQAYGYPETENMSVREHLMGAPWVTLANEGCLVDLHGQGFYKVTEEGKEYLHRDELPPPVSPIPAKVPKSATGAPVHSSHTLGKVRSIRSGSISLLSGSMERAVSRLFSTDGI